MPARRSVLALAAAGAVLAAPLVLAAPVSAAGPDTTALLTVTELEPGVEFGDWRFDVVCGTNALTAEITYWNESSIAHSFSVPLGGSQEGSLTVPGEDFYDGPGSVLDVALLCSNLEASPVIQSWSEEQTITLFDSGAWASAPDTRVGEPNSLTGSCGAADATGIAYVAWIGGTSPQTAESILYLEDLGVPLDPDGSFSLTGLPAAAAPGVYQFMIGCMRPGEDGPEASAVRYGTFTVTKALAATGDDLGAPIGLALALLAGGLALAGAGSLARRARCSALRNRS